MRCLLCAAAAALAFLCASAEARSPVHARVKCVGRYCAIVTEPGPSLRPASCRRGWTKAAAQPACR